MQKSEDSQLERSALLIEALGGEALVGTGFETEEPAPDFTVTELEREE